MTDYSRGYAALAQPNEKEIATYRDTFRRELDKRMDTNHPSASPSTEAHEIALRQFVENRDAAARSGPCVVVPRLNEADRAKASRLIAALYNDEVTTHIAVEAGAMLQHLLSLAAAKEEHDAQR